MGAWGYDAFENDEANDWAAALVEGTGLRLIEDALAAVEACGADEVRARLAVEALAACEIVARLLGRPAALNAYPRTVDAWAAANPNPVSPALQARAIACVDRVARAPSELRELFEGTPWLNSVAELRSRLQSDR